MSGKDMAFKEFSEPSFSLPIKLFGKAFSRIGKEAYCTKALRVFTALCIHTLYFLWLIICHRVHRVTNLEIKQSSSFLAVSAVTETLAVRDGLGNLWAKPHIRIAFRFATILIMLGVFVFSFGTTAMYFHPHGYLRCLIFGCFPLSGHRSGML